MDVRKKQLREKLQALTNNWKWRLASYLLRSDPTWEWSNEIPFLVPDKRTFFDAKIDVAREIVQDLKNAIDMNIEELANEINRLKREYMLVLSTLIRRANMARDKVLRTQLLSKQEVVRDFLKELNIASESIEGSKTSDLR
ncbi:MAG: hypothetical protein ACFFC7_14955 [Candidatus Hermodarchaeota archaeon]